MVLGVLGLEGMGLRLRALEIPLVETPLPIISYKGTLLGTPNREPQEYSRNIMEYKDPGRYIPIIYLLYSWGSQLGVPSRVPLS